jgi:YD repeat-containing protein
MNVKSIVGIFLNVLFTLKTFFYLTFQIFIMQYLNKSALALLLLAFIVLADACKPEPSTPPTPTASEPVCYQKSLKVGNNYAYRCEYDAQKRPILCIDSDNDTITYFYNTDGRLSSLVSKSNNVPKDYKREFFYDSRGNLIQQNRRRDVVLQENEIYEYDNTNRLIRASESLNNSNDHIFKYAYTGGSVYLSSVLYSYTAHPENNAKRSFIYDGKGNIVEQIQTYVDTLIVKQRIIRTFDNKKATQPFLFVNGFAAQGVSTGTLHPTKKQVGKNNILTETSINYASDGSGRTTSQNTVTYNYVYGSNDYPIKYSNDVSTQEISIDYQCW